MKNITPEIKNTLEGINSRINQAEEWISELKDRMVEVTAYLAVIRIKTRIKQNKEKGMKRIEGSLRDFWD